MYDAYHDFWLPAMEQWNNVPGPQEKVRELDGHEAHLTACSPHATAWLKRRCLMPEHRSPSDLVCDQETGEKRPRRKPGPKPGTEAAKRGGTAARDKYGSAFYSRIGTKGGST